MSMARVPATFRSVLNPLAFMSNSNGRIQISESGKSAPPRRSVT